MDHLLNIYEESGSYCPTDDELSPLCRQLTSSNETYSDIEVIGTGGMKTISRVFCSSSQRYVAMATLNDPTNPDLCDAFIREARMTAMLDHPNIIKVHEIALSENSDPYFTMELKAGKSLAELVTDNQSVGSDRSLRPTNNELLQIFLKICDAISYAHSRGILHLDLKPDNIQVGAFGEVIVCDWGLSKIVNDSDPVTNYALKADMLNHCTLFGQAKGTPGFMAPEQLDNSTKTAATDIYALAAILFTMQAPMRLHNKTSEDIIEESAAGLPADLYGKKFTFSKSLKAVIEKGMQKDASERYQSVEDLRSDIAQYLNGYPTEAEDANFIKQCCCLYKRNSSISIMAFATVFLIMASLLLFMSRLSKSEQRALDALQNSKSYATKLEKAILDNKHMQAHLKSMPKDIVGNIFARNQEYRDNHLLMTPDVSVKRSNQYLEAGLTVQPDNKYMLDSLACNYFISMDFEKLDQLLSRVNNTAYRKFLDQVDGKGFQTFSRMVALTEKSSSPVYMELPIAYNAHRFRDNSEFPAIISRLITFRYPESGTVHLSHDGPKLILHAPKLQKLLSPSINQSLLRYMQFKELIVTASSLRDANQFAGLPLLKLDIRGTEIRDLKPLLNIPTLDHIRITDKQISKQQIEMLSGKCTIETDRIFEAEHAQLGGKAKSYTKHDGYSGSGFIAGFHGSTKSYVNFSINVKKDGLHDITLRYSAGHGDADIELYINGKKHLHTLKHTENSWEQWALDDIPVPLKNGTNQIRIKMQRSTPKCFNLDYLSISSKLLSL